MDSFDAAMRSIGSENSADREAAMEGLLGALATEFGAKSTFKRDMVLAAARAVHSSVGALLDCEALHDLAFASLERAFDAVRAFERRWYDARKLREGEDPTARAEAEAHAAWAMRHVWPNNREARTHGLTAFFLTLVHERAYLTLAGSFAAQRASHMLGVRFDDEEDDAVPAEARAFARLQMAVENLSYLAQFVPMLPVVDNGWDLHECMAELFRLVNEPRRAMYRAMDRALDHALDLEAAADAMLEAAAGEEANEEAAAGAAANAMLEAAAENEEAAADEEAAAAVEVAAAAAAGVEMPGAVATAPKYGRKRPRDNAPQRPPSRRVAARMASALTHAMTARG